MTKYVITLILLELFSCSCLCSTIPHIILLFVEKKNVQLDIIIDSSKRQLKAIFNLGKKVKRKQFVFRKIKQKKKQQQQKQKSNGKAFFLRLLQKFSLPFYLCPTHKCFPRDKQGVAFWLVVLLAYVANGIGNPSALASTNQKPKPDLGSDTSSVWNFCSRFSDVIPRGNQWPLAVFQAIKPLKKKNGQFLVSINNAFISSQW